MARNGDAYYIDMRTITLEVSDGLADRIENSDPAELERIVAAFEREVARAQFMRTWRECSDQAKANGMTEEIAEAILREEF